MKKKKTPKITESQADDMDGIVAFNDFVGDIDHLGVKESLTQLGMQYARQWSGKELAEKRLQLVADVKQAMKGKV